MDRCHTTNMDAIYNNIRQRISDGMVLSVYAPITGQNIFRAMLENQNTPGEKFYGLPCNTLIGALDSLNNNTPPLP